MPHTDEPEACLRVKAQVRKYQKAGYLVKTISSFHAAVKSPSPFMYDWLPHPSMLHPLARWEDPLTARLKVSDVVSRWLIVEASRAGWPAHEIVEDDEADRWTLAQGKVEKLRAMFHGPRTETLTQELLMTVFDSQSLRAHRKRALEQEQPAWFGFADYVEDETEPRGFSK